jgi:uncharacterized protein YrrD
MKISVKGITSFNLGAIDGEIGTVKEIYFDDQNWILRYLIVKTGNFFKEKSILISTQALLAPDWDKQIFATNLTLDQIKNSPDIDTDKPVYRQQEVTLYDHFPWDIYWALGLMPLEDSVEIAISQKENERNSKADPHLRSSDKVIGYSINTIDTELGHVKDLIIDTDSWKILFIVIKTGHWFSGKEILLPISSVSEIDWLASQVKVETTLKEIQQCAEFDAGAAVNEEYEIVHRDYSGRRI